jgi:7,8-dihydropterin-6-yl-methyl-4-(beta-D-ribofuranosyl)aminobenzene 5'-phosphate synthase
MNETIGLQPVDAVDVTILSDNFVDVLLPSDEVAIRAPRAPDQFEREQLRAEHGYSLLVTIEKDGRRESILYDAGVGRDTVQHNLDVLGLSAPQLRAIVLSHGHADHHGGLEGIVRRIGRRRLPLVLHPDAWRQRKAVFASGEEILLPPPSRAGLEAEDVEILEERDPSMLLDGAVLITGQVERTTDFEPGFPAQQARIDGRWEPDPGVWDDQGLVINLAGKGLIVLSSCSHAGVINVLRNARRLTGVEQIHAFAGGMHLTGGSFEKLVSPTLAKLAGIAPDYIMPGHCTGWRPTHELARLMPDAYIQSSVGTRLHFA